MPLPAQKTNLLGESFAAAAYKFCVVQKTTGIPPAVFLFSLSRMPERVDKIKYSLYNIE